MNHLGANLEPPTVTANEGGSPVRVVVLTASVGAGHDGPAKEIAARLIAAGHQADLVDLVELAPGGAGRLLREAFRAELAWAPGSWGRLYDATDRGRSGARAGGSGALAALVRLVVRRLHSIIAGGPGPRAAAVVSTYPLGGHAVAAVRQRDRLRIPLISYVTDPAAHGSWVVPDTDLYLAGWASTAEQLWRHGPAPVRIIAPIVRAEFHLPADPGTVSRIRREFRLPPGPLALVMSGSWAVGNVAATVTDLLALAGPSPVVVCGRNDRLRHRMTGIPGVVPLGWVSDEAGLMHACDVAILNSGGLSLAEATAVGLPVMHYRPLIGQGVANAVLADAVGIAEWPRTRQALGAALGQVRPVNRRPGDIPADPVTEIVAVARTGTSPSTTRRRRAVARRDGARTRGGRCRGRSSGRCGGPDGSGTGLPAPPRRASALPSPAVPHDVASAAVTRCCCTTPTPLARRARGTPPRRRCRPS